MDEQKCEICDKSFSTYNNFVIHLKSYMHCEKEKCQRSIFISCVPKVFCIDDIIKYVSRFGIIVKYDVLNKESYNDITVEYQDKDAVPIILSETIKINNKQLYAYPLQYFNKNDDTNNIIRYDKIKTIFVSQSCFDIQLQAFINTVAIADEEIEIRYQSICQVLDKLFQRVFPKFKCYMYGSITTGLGLKNSDLDIYLDIGIPVIEDDTLIKGPHVITLDRVFHITEQILRKDKNLFSSCCPIRKAKMPIIKCFYLPTKVSCDISFKNNIAVYNSKLVYYYLSTNSRFKSVMMVIKYWLHNYETTVTIGITKYALAMLLIFYLQQIKLVPPVIKLQNECKVPLYIKDWQVNFNHDLTNLNIENSYTIPEIVGEFFKFYANYDFKTQVLCPIDGKSHSKESFDEKICLSPGMSIYINYLNRKENPEKLATWKPLCLQDPIELNHNLTKNLSHANLTKLQHYFSLAAKIVQASSENNYRDLLQNLFNLHNKSEIGYKVKLQKVPFEICASELFDTGLDSNIMRNVFNHKTWYDIALNIIKAIFEKVLHMKVKVSQSVKDSLSKEVKNENNENVIVLCCTGNQRLWHGRKDIKLHNNIPDPLEKEIMISNQLLKNITMKKDVINIVIDVECHILRRTTPSDHMSITLLNSGCSENTFNEFTNYLLTKIPSILRKAFCKIITQDEKYLNNLLTLKF